MRRRNGRAVRAAVVLAASGLAAACSGAAATMPSSVRASSAHQAGTVIRPCGRGQLVVGGLGLSTAAGTVILTIRVTNVSPRSCRLDGRPVVTFLGAAGQALPVAESALTSVQRAAVRLVPRAYGATAGFVITTVDDMMPGEPCESVAALRIALPSVSGSFIAGGLSNPDFRYSVCERGFPARVSPIAVGALLDGYAPAFPACLASQLGASVTVSGDPASGTRLVLTVTSHSAAVCTVDGYPDASLTNGGQVILAYRAGQASALLPAPAAPRPVTLIDGASASATLATAASSAGGPRCHTWHTLLVAVPGGSGTLSINRTLDVCGAVPGAGAFVAGS